MKTNEEFTKWLKSHGACSAGMREVAKQTPEEFYNTCSRPDWLLWWFRRGNEDKLPGYPTKENYKACAIAMMQYFADNTKDSEVKRGTLLLVEFFNTGKVATRNEARKILNEAREAAFQNLVKKFGHAAAAAYAYAAAAAYADAYAAAAAYAYAAADAAADAAALRASAIERAKKIKKDFCEIIRSICKINFN